MYMYIYIYIFNHLVEALTAHIHTYTHTYTHTYMSLVSAYRLLRRDLYEEFTRLAETRLAQNSLSYLKIAQTTLTIQLIVLM